MARPPTPTEIQRIQGALSTGGKIASIKLCREFTGMDLASAKAYVENLGPSAPGEPGDVAGKLPVDVSGPITAALFAGEKIQAIKLYREMHPGMGLAEAKEAVEKLAERLYAMDPGQFTRPPQSAGCASVFVFGFLLPIVAWYLATR